MSSPTMEKERTSVDSAEDVSVSGSGDESPTPPPRRATKTARKTSRRSGGKSLSNLPLDQLPLSGVQDTAERAVGGVTNTLGNVANNTVQSQGSGGGGKSDTLRLRLDLNLDIEIQLKAKIHGDLELALLN